MLFLDFEKPSLLQRFSNPRSKIGDCFVDLSRMRENFYQIAVVQRHWFFAVLQQKQDLSKPLTQSSQKGDPYIVNW